MNLPRVAAQRRLVLIALLGVGLPVVVLAGFGAYQTRHVQSFLSETSSDYGGYAAGLVARSLAGQINARVEAVSEYARMAASWGGSSSRYLQLLGSQDPLLSHPFLISDVDLLSAAQGDTLEEFQGEIWSQATAMAGPIGNEVERIHAPISIWQDIIGTVYDTVFVVPETEFESPVALAPLIGFGGRVVGVAGWRLNTEILDENFFDSLVSSQVYEDPRIYRGDVMSSGLSLSVLDGQGEVVYRSSDPGTDHAWAETAVGSILPGWRVAVGPSAGSAALSVRRFVLAQYVVLFLLVFTILGALWFSIRQAGEQLQLADAKTSFLANVSHELKTPLALIRLAGETMELDRIRNEAERRKFLQVISRECRRLTHMINNVLNFAKLEAGRKEFHFHPTDIKRIVGETMETFERQLEEKRFEVRVDLPEKLPMVEADSEALTQCLVNLIDNAMKYSGEERFLEIKVRVEEPGQNGDDGQARISVSDRGMGISARERHKVFEKFARAESGLVHNVRGSGLGLSLVRHIMQAHGGRVELQSTPGKGSTFTLIMPALQNSQT